MENMREMLRSSLGRSLSALTPMDRLAAAWPVACGAALARRGVPVAFEDGVLQVEVADPAWMEQWLGMRAVLEADLGRIAGVKLGGIHFKLTGSGDLRRDRRDQERQDRERQERPER